MPHPAPKLPARRRTPAGFTLVELMISIALVLVLILGVNQVFRIATQSVGAGQALSDQSRENRAVQTVLYNDLSQSVIRSIDAPLLLINGRWTSAFLDREDELSDRDYQALYPTPAATPTADQVDAAIRTIDLDNDNVEGEATEPGEILARNRQSNRVFRQDMLSFFARHLYPRQTGNDGVYVSQMTANEAFIWYGHLKQPPTNLNDTATNQNPGWRALNPAMQPPTNRTTNPNNFYARNWGLGRAATMLVQPNTAPGTEQGRILDKTGARQWFYARASGLAAQSFGPLSQGISARQQAPPGADGPADTSQQVQYNRYDLAGTTIDGFRSIVRTALTTPPGNPDWWDDGTGNMGYRRQGYAFPTSPLSSYGVARTVPWLVGGCTNFIVEYAGDYLEEDIDPTSATYGAVGGNYTTGAVDGVTDFLIDAAGARRTRWYGMPRDVSSATAGNVGRPDGVIEPGPDVLPLETLLGIDLPHEHQQNIDTAANGFAFMTTEAEYNAAWQPNGTYPGGAPDVPKPTMLRITMTIDDPSGRLPEGQTYEYVIELPG